MESDPVLCVALYQKVKCALQQVAKRMLALYQNGKVSGDQNASIY
jgi:hypothetical protein